MSNVLREGVTAVRISSDTAISGVGVPGILYGLTLKGGTTASSISIVDGGSGGTPRWELTIGAQTVAGDISKSITFNPGIVFETDLYANITGTGAAAYIQYKVLD